MNFIRTAIAEIWGLFVEDSTFTVGIVACVAVAIFILPRIAIAAEWRGPVLFLILALVLVENVRRSARG
ncbi:MAG: hypothetical protein M3R65_10620 [Gemmatimonadota bacterium]|nr:hypothetical protein [Gemmatimonadota bacterium]